MSDAAAPAVRPRALAADFGPLVLGLGAALGIGALGAADGGYFPPAWGWTALVSLWVVVACVLLGRAALHGGRLAWVFLGSLFAFAAWTWLSLLWTENSVQTVQEGFRMLAYAGATAALVLLVRRETAWPLVRGLTAAVTLVVGYGLGTRLFPDRLGTYDPISAYRLSEPVGYWNGLGIFAAIGIVLALGLVARDRAIVSRALAGAASVLLVVALYFTFSRGAWLALAAGLAAAIALDPRRLQLILALLVVGLPALVAAFAASQSEALTRRDYPLSDAAEQGHEVALIVALLALAAAAAAVGLAHAERRIRPRREARLAFAGAVTLIAVAAMLLGLVRLGGPVEAVDRAYDAFRAAPPSDPEDLRDRLFTFTGSYRVELWQASWDQFKGSPVVGEGAGTYEQHWLEERPLPHEVRDGHNLYLETLGELGIIGLALLLVALAAPLAAAVRARRNALAAGVLGAYVAYLVHAAVDWDWELPAVTITALACGAVLLALRDRADALQVEGRARVVLAGTAAALAIVAFVGLVGFSAVNASADAAAGRTPNYDEAEDEARKARRWARWSSEPWQRLGEAQLGNGDAGAARQSFRKAIEKEPTDWLLWLRLAEASTGAERQQAIARAERLNPRSFQVVELREEGS
jgi:tetratricopeptide (TPR) repeat protein